jgi:hypothetical protein
MTEFEMTDLEKNDLDIQYPRLTVADAFFGLLLSRYLKGCEEFREKIRVLFGLRTRNNGKARAQLLNPTLKSSQNLLRIKALDALIADETVALKPLIQAVLERMGVIEMARQERRLYIVAERRNRHERNTRDLRQLTPLTYAAVDKLYHDYGVDGSALSSLTEDDYRQIAAIANARHRETVPEAYMSKS